MKAKLNPMFLYLNEADNEEINEPMEDDAEMNLEPETQDNEDESSEQSNDNMDEISEDTDSTGDESLESDMDEEANEDSIEGETPQESNNQDDTKKLKLFNDYNMLLNTTESIISFSNNINKSQFSETELRVFKEIEVKVDDFYNKLKDIIINQYEKLEYTKLLTLFIYLKMGILNYSEILNKFIE